LPSLFLESPCPLALNPYLVYFEDGSCVPFVSNPGVRVACVFLLDGW
jgi:hypothetical protein